MFFGFCLLGFWAFLAGLLSSFGFLASGFPSWFAFGSCMASWLLGSLGFLVFEFLAFWLLGFGFLGFLDFHPNYLRIFLFFWAFCFSLFAFLCFSAFLGFSAFVLRSFSASLASLLFCFSAAASLIVCFAFPFFYVFVCSSSLL